MKIAKLRMTGGHLAAKKPKRQRNGDNPQLDTDTPIYVQLITHFRQKIETDRWQVNETIPALEELAAEYGVARGTIRQAIGFLQREGLIASRRGRGSQVVRKPDNTIWMPLPDSWDDLLHQADSIVGEVLDLDVPKRLPVSAENGRGALAPNYHAVRRLLKRNGIPYLVGTSYVDQRIMAEAGFDALATMSIYRVLEHSQRSRAVAGEQTLMLRPADAEVAYLLQIPLNGAVVCVMRWVFDQHDTLIYQSEGLFRSDFVQADRRLK